MVPMSFCGNLLQIENIETASAIFQTEINGIWNMRKYRFRYAILILVRLSVSIGFSINYRIYLLPKRKIIPPNILDFHSVFDRRRFSMFLLFFSDFRETKYQGYPKEIWYFANDFRHLCIGKKSKSTNKIWAPLIPIKKQSTRLKSSSLETKISPLRCFNSPWHNKNKYYNQPF